MKHTESRARNASIREFIVAGGTVPDACKQFKVRPGTVYDAIVGVKPQHEFSRRQRREIADFMKDALNTVESAAKHFGVDVHYVYKSCSEHGVKYRNNVKAIPNPNSFAIMRELWGGKNQADVAREFGVTYQRVQQILNAAIDGGWHELKKCKRGAK